ncbi:hypothetical protein [Dyella caseinilytica]|nr:hypothetical protein [Dyella caseinilytica]
MSQPRTIIGNYLSRYVRKVLVCLEGGPFAWRRASRTAMHLVI